MTASLSVIEIAAGVLGLAGSLLLVVPAVRDLRNRQFWDGLKGLERIKGTRPQDIDALRGVLLDRLLGGHRLHAWCTLGGGTLLAIAFALVLATGVARLTGA